jgi:hypothetical protein
MRFGAEGGNKVGAFSREAEIFSVRVDAALVFRIHNQYN